MGPVFKIARCTSKCEGLCCCNCCGDAPALHRAGYGYIPFQMYDVRCCRRTRANIPESCMWEQGKTRTEWLKEMED